MKSVKTKTKIATQSFVLPALIAFALIGCGGGGGGSTPAPTTTTTTVTTTAPAAPNSLNATSGDVQVSLSWLPVADATSYNLYWSTVSGVTPASGTKISSISSPFVHSGLSNNSTYFYVLTAVNAVGESAPSLQVSATPQALGASGYTIGGQVVGLASGQSVVLQNNGGNDLTVTANGSFVFANTLAYNTSYNVTVLTQPSNGQTCSVMKNGSSSGLSGLGTVAYSNVDTVRVSCASVFTFAGSGLSGQGDAIGEIAVFNGPSGAAFDTAGNLYVTDAVSNVVRKITPTGEVSTLAGVGRPGYKDATGTAAQFNFSTGVAGIAADASGNVYVADTLNNVIRKITPARVVTTLAGSGVAGYADATGAAAQFNAPQGVAVDSSGNIYVADTNNQRIRKITPAGTVTTLAGSGSIGYTDAFATLAVFSNPRGIAVDAAGNAYVVEAYNHTVRKITPAGSVTTLAGGYPYGGYLDATGAAAQFNSLQSVAVDGAGNVYVTDANNYVVRMITPAGVVSTLAGLSTSAYSDGPVSLAKLKVMQGIAVDGSGTVYVADRASNRIRKIAPTAYSYTVSGHVVGLISGASLVLQNNAGDNLTITSDGKFTFATPLTDVGGSASYNVTILSQPPGQTCTVANGTGGFVTGNVLGVRVNCAQVSTFAGSGVSGYLDATGTAAQFNLTNNPATGMAVDSVGNVYVADTYNHMIRKITPQGVVTTLAGATLDGSSDGTGSAASFRSPAGLAVDAAGNVYVADSPNCMIRKITPAGVVTTVAGSVYCGYTNGVGTAAQFDGPTGVAVDGSGNLYVVDSINQVIRKITSSGVVSTFAGPAAPTINAGYVDGDSASARFLNPYAIAIDSAGNLYVAEEGNHAIRKITQDGVVSTLAGPGQRGDISGSWSGYVNSTGVSALFNYPSGIAVDSSGNVYVSDKSNHAIRMINPSGTVRTLAGPEAPLTTIGNVNGNGATALFKYPDGVAVDAVGNVYVGDSGNNVIRKIVQ